MRFVGSRKSIRVCQTQMGRTQKGERVKIPEKKETKDGAKSLLPDERTDWPWMGRRGAGIALVSGLL